MRSTSSPPRADGDARRALTVLEAAADSSATAGTSRRAVAREAMQLRFARHDKSGEEHFNLLSALSQVAARQRSAGALYWMARMIEAARIR
jgi:putative ATPase